MNTYTVYGSQEFEDYIANCLQKISDKFQDSIDCSDLHALILGGGYGRGEGGVLNDGQERLYNDLDFFVISKKLTPMRIKQIKRSLSDLHHELSAEMGVDVDFADPKPITYLPVAPLSIMLYDLSMGHKVIWGKQNILKGLPAWNPKQLPLMEAFKLLLNRGMGLYFAKQHLLAGNYQTETDFINRNILKAYQAMGEAILIFEGNYHWSAKQRMVLMQNVELSQYTNDSQFLSLYLEAMRFKLQPWISNENQDALTIRLEQALSIYKELYYRLWNKYFTQNRITCQTGENVYQAYLSGLCLANLEEPGILMLAKNLALNLRDTKVREFNLSIGSRYPRYRLFYALPWLLFGEFADLTKISQILGIPETQDLSLLQKRFVHLWQKYN